jgi:hypothetical protein
MCQNPYKTCWDCQDRVKCWEESQPKVRIVSFEDTLRRWDQVNKE